MNNLYNKYGSSFKWFLLSILFPFLSNAQDLGFSNVTIIEGSQDVKGISICSDNFGNVYSAGDYVGSVTIDTGLASITLNTASGTSDVYLVKKNSNGQVKWAKSFNGPGLERIFEIQADFEGNIWLAGQYTESMNLNPDSAGILVTSNGIGDFFLVKLDSNGQFLFGTSIGSTLNEACLGMHIDNAGNVYTTGYFGGTVDFDPGPGTSNLTSVNSALEIFISKYDNQGSFVWAKSLSGNSNDVGYGIDTDSWGNVIVTGYFIGSLDFDPGPSSFSISSLGGKDVFVLKLDSLGDFLWAKSFAGSGNDDQGRSLVVDGQGNVNLTGYFTGSIDIDPDTSSSMIMSAGSNDIFLVQLDSSGSLNWGHSFGSIENDVAIAIASDQLDQVYITGFFRNTIDFDPGVNNFNVSSNGAADVYVSKYSSQGMFITAKGFGGFGGEEGNGINVDLNGNVHTSGSFNSMTDFDPNSNSTVIVSPTNYDGFAHSFQPCSPSSAIINVDACESYTSNPLGITYTSSGQYIETISNGRGCDSVITINLNIFSVDTSLIVMGDSIMAIDTSQGVVYQWIDCANSSIIIGEANALFVPATSGSYAVIVSNGACQDTSACRTIIVQSIIEPGLLKNDVRVYPNPTQGIVNVTSSEKMESVNIYDLNGKLKLECNKNCESLNISQLERGVYLIEVKTNNQTRIKRLVIEDF